jgi:diguanylate cyclase (GGDEF)-like protein
MALEDEKEKTRRIVVVDDDAHTRNLLRELCESWGFETRIAEDGEQALALIAEKPDLVLLDLMMPRLDGFEVLRRIREGAGPRDLPVILLTAVGDVDGKIRGIELGADDYVTKPFRITDLQRRISAVLDKRRYRDRLKGEGAGDAGQDPLTGVGTFPQLREGLADEVTRARAQTSPLAALIVAVDDYPLVFDDLQREDANGILVKLAQVLRRCFRQADRVYRIDVEAFVVLLPDTAREGALIAAERLVKGFCDEPMQAPGGRKITVSAGVADYPRFGADRADGLIRAANRALARARRLGPGRFEAAGEEDPPSAP